MVAVCGYTVDPEHPYSNCVLCDEKLKWQGKNPQTVVVSGLVKHPQIGLPVGVFSRHAGPGLD